MPQFPPSPITSLIDEKPLYNLGESFGPHIKVGELLPAGGMSQLALGYGTSAGALELRQLLAANMGVHGDNVLVTAGAVSALFLVALLVADEDAEIVVVQPCFPPTVAALQGIGARLVTLQLRFEHGYRLDLPALRSKLSIRTRLVSIASPQNPSGVAINRREIEEVLAAMASVCPDALLLIDETYREAVYGQAAVPESVASLSEQVMTCGSLSKAHGAPGLRIGWLTVRKPDLCEQLRLAKFNTGISCGSVDEFLAIELLRRAETILAPRRVFLADALTVVEKWVETNREHIRWVRPEAGAMCCVQLNPAVFARGGVKQFYSQLRQRRTLIAPGEWFGDSSHVFRLGFAYEPIEKLRTGLDIISDVLRNASKSTSQFA
jgi:aspartate/methionine/tyrosine aminotransferase